MFEKWSQYFWENQCINLSKEEKATESWYDGSCGTATKVMMLTGTVALRKCVNTPLHYQTRRALILVINAFIALKCSHDECLSREQAPDFKDCPHWASWKVGSKRHKVSSIDTREAYSGFPSSIRLEIAQPSHMPKVWEHFLQEFCTAEPCFRSIGIFKEENLSTMGGKINKWITKKYFIKPMLSNGCSIIALSDAGEIVGKAHIWISNLCLHCVLGYY